MAHSNTTASIEAGMKALPDGVKAFSHTQAMWRFLNNEQVTPVHLSEPLLANCHEAVTEIEGDYVLSMNDWSRINYGSHRSKKDRLQMTHQHDVGYELQSSLLVDAENGKPLSVAAQNLVCAEGSWQSRCTTLQADDQTHLDELSERIGWLEQQQFARRLVHIVDREADSVDHLRRWSREGSQWLVRAKAGSQVRYGEETMALSDVAAQLKFRFARQVTCKGQSCYQWIASTTVVMTRKGHSKRSPKTQAMDPATNEVLSVRLVVSHILNEEGDVVAQWYLLSNVDHHIEATTLALWYYYRWQIESFFKLLKAAGHQLESWEQETARATFNRLLIASQACVMAWRLMHAQEEAAKETCAFLVRLAGRQMKRTRPVTAPALLAGLFQLFAMLDTLEHYSIAELKHFANIAKQKLNL